MVTSVSRWGNSIGIRIPKAILKKANICVNDLVNMSCEGNKIVLEKSDEVSIKKLFENYKGNDRCEEVDWGEPVGKEIW